MRINSKYIYGLFGVALALTGCNSEELTSPTGTADGETLHVTLTVNRPSASTRTTLTETENGRALESKWEATDKVLVVNSANQSVGELTLDSGAGSTSAVFSGNLTIDPEQTYTVCYLGATIKDTEAPYTEYLPYAEYKETDGVGSIVNKLAGQEVEVVGTLADLSRADFMMKEGIKFTVADGKAYPSEDVTLVPQNAMVHFTLSGLPTLGEDSEATLTVTYGDENVTYSYNVTTIERDIYLPFKAGYKDYSFTLTADKVYMATVSSDDPLEAGLYYAVTDTETGKGTGIDVALEDDDLVGPIFEVNGKKFRFTRANLQYNTKTSVWSIPEYQTEFVGRSGRRYLSGQASNQPEVIDLFGWGATGIDDKVYQPRPADFWKEYAYNTNNKNVIDGQYPSANTSQNSMLSNNSTLCPNASMQDTPFDWGKAYSASHSGHYFTLTSVEMNGVISGYCVVLGTVDNVKGAILTDCSTVDELKAKLDDMKVTYTKATLYKLTSGSSKQTEYAWDRLSLTYDQLSKLNGVFFPAAGMRNPGIDTDYDDTGNYWTATVTTTPNANAWCFDGQATQSRRAFLIYGRGKGQAFSVRLVKEVVDNN